jgi:hypothetical protein
MGTLRSVCPLGPKLADVDGPTPLARTLAQAAACPVQAGIGRARSLGALIPPGALHRRLLAL